MKKIIAVSIIGAFFLAGCGKEEIYTLDYYEKNDDARAAKIAKCEKTAKMNAEEMANCHNAKRAQELINASQPIDLSDIRVPGKANAEQK